MGQRLRGFVLDHKHNLAKGLIVAGLCNPGNSSRVFIDSSGFGNHGTISGISTSDWVYDNTIKRTAIKLDTVAKYITGPILKQISGDVTYCCWIYCTAINGNGSCINTLDNSGWSTGSTLSAKIALTTSYYSINNGWVSAGDVISLSTWTHLAVTVNSLLGVQFYFNGVAKQFNADTTSSVVTPTVPYTIAMGYDGSVTTGIYSDIMIYNRALSGSEIQQLADPGDPTLSGLIKRPRIKSYGIPRDRTVRYLNIGGLLLKS